VLAATQRAPLTATVLVVELTYSGAELVVPVLVAVGCAVAVVRLLPAPPTVVRRV
jgi:H+/Cl- antiporter ClcA